MACTSENGERLSSGYILILTTRVKDMSETNSSAVCLKALSSSAETNTHCPRPEATTLPYCF